MFTSSTLLRHAGSFCWRCCVCRWLIIPRIAVNNNVELCYTKEEAEIDTKLELDRDLSTRRTGSDGIFRAITYLFAGEENRCGGEPQLKISRGWFSHRLGRRHKVQKIVNELEGQTEIFAVLEGGFDERRVGSGYCGGL